VTCNYMEAMLNGEWRFCRANAVSVVNGLCYCSKHAKIKKVATRTQKQRKSPIFEGRRPHDGIVPQAGGNRRGKSVYVR